MNKYILSLATNTRSLKHCLLTLKLYLEMYVSETIMNVHKILKLKTNGHNQWRLPFSKGPSRKRIFRLMLSVRWNVVQVNQQHKDIFKRPNR